MSIQQNRTEQLQKLGKYYVLPRQYKPIWESSYAEGFKTRTGFQLGPHESMLLFPGYPGEYGLLKACIS